MNMRLFEIALCALALQSSYVHALAPDDLALDAPVEKFEAQAGGEFHALCKNILRKPCGVEGIFGDAERRDKELPPFRLSKTSGRKILNEITKRSPGSKWAIRNGVINFEPKNLGDDPLSKKLDKVSIHGASSFQAVRMVLDQAKIRFTYQVGRGSFGTVDLDLKNVTVREVLNAIVNADGEVMWIFIHRPKEEGVKRQGTLMMPSWRKEGIGPHGEASKNEKKQ